MEYREIVWWPFSEQTTPHNQKIFSAVHNRLRNTRNDTVRDRSVSEVDFEERVIQRFEGDPTTSWVVGRELGRCKDTVWKVLLEEKLHPYSPQEVQALKTED